MKRKTPPEKKALSYARDCRNTHGENDKVSRKSIRRNKTINNQSYRRRVNQILSAIDSIEIESAENIDIKAKLVQRRKWKNVLICL